MLVVTCDDCNHPFSATDTALLKSDWKTCEARCLAGAPCSVVYPTRYSGEVLGSTSPQSSLSEDTLFLCNSFASCSSGDILAVLNPCESKTSSAPISVTTSAANPRGSSCRAHIRPTECRTRRWNVLLPYNWRAWTFEPFLLFWLMLNVI